VLTFRYGVGKPLKISESFTSYPVTSYEWNNGWVHRSWAMS